MRAIIAGGVVLSLMLVSQAPAESHGMPMRNFPGFLVTGRAEEGSFQGNDLVFPHVVVCTAISRGVRKDPGLTFPKVADPWQGDVVVVDPRNQIGSWVRVVGEVTLADDEGNVLPEPVIAPLEGWILSEVLCDFVRE